MSKIIGIDFGTTKAIAAAMKDGSPVVIPDRRGRNSIPSLVLLTPETEKKIFVGWEAQQHSKRYHLDHLTISSIKRSLGKERKQMWQWLHEHPEAIAGLILARLKLEIEHQLGEQVEQVVIAIPANYSLNQRWAIKQAAELAGLNVLRLMNEATAAALYYQSIHPKEAKTLMIFDLGGGTLDVSIVEVGEGVCDVKATAGDGELGGDDFDQAMMDYVAQTAFAETTDFNSLELFQQLVLREAITKAKIELSSAYSSQIYLPGFIQIGSHPPQNLDIIIEREKFNELSQILLKRAEEVIKCAMKDAGLKGEQLDAALIIGGGSRIPAVRELVYQTIGKRPYIGVDPEICVAQGAALQAGIMGGGIRDTLLLDATPHSLSIETLGGVATKLIERNTTLPTRISETFSTATDSQTEIKVNVYEGERSKAVENRFLGSLILDGIKPAPKGTTNIEVTFDIDANGLLTVSAKNLASGKEVKSAFHSPSRLTDEEIAASRQFMAQVISKIAIQLSWEEEKERLEDLQRKVSIWKQDIADLIEAQKDNLADQQLSILQSGLQLLLDFIERGTAEEELEKIYASLKQQIDIFKGAN